MFVLFSEFISSFSGPDSDREEHLQASSRQGPPPDLLPQNEHPSWASPQHRAPRGEAVQELELLRVANQLRVIGDEFNATVLRRAVSEGMGSPELWFLTLERGEALSAALCNALF
uniref:Uncharacterized protein n=1 Tax=Amphiprion ocellaris TaxID=80972 RepID=A0A3Q1AY04_AMPOC